MANIITFTKSEITLETWTGTIIPTPFKAAVAFRSACAANGAIIVAAEKPNQLFLLDDQCQLKHAVSLPGGLCPYGVTMTQDAKRVYSGTTTGEIVEYSVQAGRLEFIKQWLAHTGSIRRLVFNSLSGQLVSAGKDDNTVSFWNCETGEKLKSFCHQRQCSSWSVETWGDLTIVGYSNGLLVCWRPDGSYVELVGHKGNVVGLAVNQATNELVSTGDFDNTVRLWDLTNMQCRWTYAITGANRVSSAAFLNNFVIVCAEGATTVSLDTASGTVVRAHSRPSGWPTALLVSQTLLKPSLQTFIVPIERRFTPLDKLFKNLSKIADHQTPIVLLTTGSFNPGHKAHITLHHHVKAVLEAIHPQLCVVGAFLSPTHDDYVFDKLKSQGRTKTYLDFSTRCTLLDACLTDDSLVAVDRVCDNRLSIHWEGSQPFFIDFPSVVAELQKYMLTIPSHKPIKVLYVVGSDMLKCHIHISFPRKSLGLVVVLREQYDLSKFGVTQVPYEHHQLRDSIFYLPPVATEEVSSTLIHQLFTQGKDFSHLMHPAAAALLQAKWSK